MEQAKKFIAGGWLTFAEETGVNKKEPVENFEWMSSDKQYYFIDCHDALEKVEGAREWLKAYTCDEADEPFWCEMATSVGSHMSGGHTNESFISIMWSYKDALNNWDNWVYETKKRDAQKEYMKCQVSLFTLRELLQMCYTWFKYEGQWAGEIEYILKRRTGLTGTVPEIQLGLEGLLAELNIIQALNE